MSGALTSRRPATHASSETAAWYASVSLRDDDQCGLNKKHLKNVGPIRHCEPPILILHCHSPGVATVARRLRIDVHNNNNNDNNNNA